MNTQKKLRNCVSRIEALLTTATHPDFGLIEKELSFLDRLILMSMNDVEIEGEKVGRAVQVEEDINIYPSGTVIIIIPGSGFADIKDALTKKFEKVLREDQDWISENYVSIFSDNIEESFAAWKQEVNYSKTSRYTLNSGETAYLIKVL